MMYLRASHYSNNIKIGVDFGTGVSKPSLRLGMEVDMAVCEKIDRERRKRNTEVKTTRI